MFFYLVFFIGSLNRRLIQVIGNECYFQIENCLPCFIYFENLNLFTLPLLEYLWFIDRKSFDLSKTYFKIILSSESFIFFNNLWDSHRKILLQIFFLVYPRIDFYYISQSIIFLSDYLFNCSCPDFVKQSCLKSTFFNQKIDWKSLSDNSKF